MAESPGPAAAPLRIERHRAERLADIAVVGSVCCSSCCCCCCCVHSIGGITGAAIGSAIAGSRGAGSEEVVGARILAAGYWIGFGVVAALVCLAAALDDSLWMGLGAVALAGPALQLVMSVLALPLALAQRAPRRTGALRALGAITLGAVLGAILGGGLMLVVFLLAAVLS